MGCVCVAVGEEGMFEWLGEGGFSAPHSTKFEFKRLCLRRAQPAHPNHEAEVSQMQPVAKLQASPPHLFLPF